jgi:hypothetical protein
VTQYKDNRFERDFYELDREIANAQFKTTYYIPALESELAKIINARSQWNNKHEKNPILPAMNLLREEIRLELRNWPANAFTEVERIEIGKFDSTVHRSTETFLKRLSNVYRNRVAMRTRERDSIRNARTSTPEARAAFDKMREDYQNNAVSDMVKNINETSRIIAWRGQLVQKFYPIYMDDTRPIHALDYRAPFYSPVKYFFGRYWDTLYFNIAVIWVMSLILYITLYFELLKRAVNSVEMYKKYSRRLVRTQ